MYLPGIQAYPQSGRLVGGSTHVPSLPFRLACTFEQTVRRPLLALRRAGHRT